MIHIKKLALLLVLSLFVISCSSDSSSDNNNNSFYLKFKVNGTPVSFEDPSVINSLSKAINGYVTNGKSLTLYMPLTAGVGTHTITHEPSNENSYGASYSDFAEDESSDGETGTLTITEVNADVIKGTFSFTFTETSTSTTYTITEGEFRAENIE